MTLPKVITHLPQIYGVLFIPIFNIILYTISYMRRNSNYMKLLPAYFEVIFQTFNPIATLAIIFLLKAHPWHVQ